MKSKVTTFIVKLAERTSSDSLIQPIAGSPLILKYDIDAKNFWDGRPVPTALSVKHDDTFDHAAHVIFAGIVLPVQPKQTLISEGYTIIAACVRGPCQALLFHPEAPTLTNCKPGDLFNTYCKIKIGTVMAQTNRCHYAFKKKQELKKLTFVHGLVMVTCFGPISQ